MVSKKEIRDQLKNIGYSGGWTSRAEVSELPNVIMPGEEIYECVNGSYEGGFALLVATNIRLLLIDKKPLNYLTVEDMRFDMISQMDYNHRLIGASIRVAAGDKNLAFRSYNQSRLRKLIGHVQHCMAEAKKQQSSHQDTQASHLQQINEQLGSYLASQNQYQLQIQQLNGQPSTSQSAIPEPPKPSNELADYLYAQSLLANYNKTNQINPIPTETVAAEAPAIAEPIVVERKDIFLDQHKLDTDDMYNEALKEVFGPTTVIQPEPSQSQLPQLPQLSNQAEINPMQVAYSKLPTALRDKKFGTHLLKRQAA